jgi:uncharacterized protein YbaR (Trm112 family)
MKGGKLMKDEKIKENKQDQSSKPRCMVCDKEFAATDKIFVCPWCKKQAHVNHIKLWVMKSKDCPKCEKPLKIDDKGEVVKGEVVKK